MGLSGKMETVPAEGRAGLLGMANAANAKSQDAVHRETHNIKEKDLKKYPKQIMRHSASEYKDNFKIKLNTIPTGIKTFDANIFGGFPSGSVILLLEDVGAGAREFLYTSIFNIIKQKDKDPDAVKLHRELLNYDEKLTGVKKAEQSDADEVSTAITLPDEICYISVSKSKDDILKENAYAFDRDFYRAIKDGLVFKELSDVYFRYAMAHNFWDKNQAMNFDISSDRNILEEIAAFLVEHAACNIVILDSLTELMMHEGDYLKKNDIIMFLKGMVRVSKTWNGLIYLVLSANILEKQMQETITDLVDGVLVFEWVDRSSAKMRRSLHISKFRGLMPRVEQNNIAKFETKITSDVGFDVSNVRKLV